jgi:hypothetical protein
MIFIERIANNNLTILLKILSNPAILCRLALANVLRALATAGLSIALIPEILKIIPFIKPPVGDSIALQLCM